MRDVKVIPKKECVTQHKLFVCDARIVKSEDRFKNFVPKRRVCKLQQADLHDKFCETLTSEINYTSCEQVDDIWSRLKQGLLSAIEKTYGWTKKGIWRENKRGVGMKRSVKIYLRREDCGSWGRRLVAKINIWMQNGKHDVLSTQLREMQKRRSFLVLKTIFRFVKQMPTENQDVIGEKCIRSDDGKLCLDGASKKLAWKQHCERLLNF